jgi:hypothetical protein
MLCFEHESTNLQGKPHLHNVPASADMFMQVADLWASQLNSGRDSAYDGIPGMQQCKQPCAYVNPRSQTTHTTTPC